ncbi:hypothetical protein AMJ44_14900 [candidate division WOR-1 bacterium DG_54_3]|uniref:Uncharacterized protein n=1 Tax=candidate division WOR-1 bacterium DG_54_3 TaxID=1703775 RepID=A0A0S7XKN0_UNCSA|nr:MAG: hypothetical protein AMJ44_14900 [candidate division WOR-1 bacterium DG_54_3]
MTKEKIVSIFGKIRETFFRLIVGGLWHNSNRKLTSIREDSFSGRLKDNQFLFWNIFAGKVI